MQGGAGADTGEAFAWWLGGGVIRQGVGFGDFRCTWDGHKNLYGCWILAYFMLKSDWAFQLWIGKMHIAGGIFAQKVGIFAGG